MSNSLKGVLVMKRNTWLTVGMVVLIFALMLTACDGAGKGSTSKAVQGYDLVTQSSSLEEVKAAQGYDLVTWGNSPADVKTAYGIEDSVILTQEHDDSYVNVTRLKQRNASEQIAAREFLFHDGKLYWVSVDYNESVNPEDLNVELSKIYGKGGVKVSTEINPTYDMNLSRGYTGIRDFNTGGPVTGWTSNITQTSVEVSNDYTVSFESLPGVQVILQYGDSRKNSNVRYIWQEGLTRVEESVATARNAESTEADFTVVLTEDRTGAVITEYTGMAFRVRIPETIQGMPVKEIRKGARGNTISVVIPTGVKIGPAAFENCKNLKTVEIASGITKIPDFAFNGCESLVSVSIPEGVTEIGVRAFSLCLSLASVNFPGSLKKIGGGAFAKCYNLTSFLIPEGVERIEGSVPGRTTFSDVGAFFDCPKLATVSLPSTIKYIGCETFDSCVSLTDVTIPDAVTTIEYEDRTNYLYHVYPETLLEVAFSNCPKLPLATQSRLAQIKARNIY
jgi:hypothetical protein